MNAITVVLISDEEISRVGVKYLLESDHGFKVTGHGVTNDALQMSKKCRPDVMVLQIDSARPEFVSLVRSVCDSSPQTQILILGRAAHDGYLGLLLASGAKGYVLLQSPSAELFSAVRAVAIGRRFIDSRLGDVLVDTLVRQAHSELKLLSRREQQVLRLYSFGYTLVDIATELNISRKSTETYWGRIREKLGLETRADAVRYALATGILSPEKQQVS